MGRLTCRNEGCGAFSVDDEGYCINHTERADLKAKVQAGRARGGLTVKSRLEATPEDIERHKPDATQQAALDAQRASIGAMLSALEVDPHNLKIAAALSLAAKRLSAQIQSTILHDAVDRLTKEVAELRERT